MVNKTIVKNVFWYKHYKCDRENFFQDDSGTIEMAELVEIIGTLYEMEVVTSLKKWQHGKIEILQGVNKEFASARAEKIFEQLDEDGNGELDEEEFCRFCIVVMTMRRIVRMVMRRTELLWNWRLIGSASLWYSVPGVPIRKESEIGLKEMA